MKIIRDIDKAKQREEDAGRQDKIKLLTDRYSQLEGRAKALAISLSNIDEDERESDPILWDEYLALERKSADIQFEMAQIEGQMKKVTRG